MPLCQNPGRLGNIQKNGSLITSGMPVVRAATEQDILNNGPMDIRLRRRYAFSLIGVVGLVRCNAGPGYDGTFDPAQHPEQIMAINARTAKRASCALPEESSEAHTTPGVSDACARFAWKVERIGATAAFSIVETVCRNVKRRHGGDQRERWVGSGLLVAFRRVRGYKQIPMLLRVLETLKPSSKEVAARRKAS